MASEYSFDIVSEVDLQEVDNALNQVKKEILNRYDFKGSMCVVEFDRKDKAINLKSDNKMRHEAVIDILKGRLAKRNISLKALKFDTPDENISGEIKQIVHLISGISKENGKKIIGMIKDLKVKVAAQIQDDQVRVSSKNKDELQNVITHFQGVDFEVPLQFTNYR